VPVSLTLTNQGSATPDQAILVLQPEVAVAHDHRTTAGAEVAVVVPLETVSVLSLRLKVQGFREITSPSCGPAPVS
jgi:hypothetical protein